MSTAVRTSSNPLRPKRISLPSVKLPSATLSSKTERDALARLKADHRHIEQLFDRYESAAGPAKKQVVVQTICEELTVHAALEESYLYPVARDALAKEQHLVNKAIVEHSVLKWLADQLTTDNPQSALYDAKVKVLKDLVIRHAKEEEKTLFRKVGRRLPYWREFGEMLSDAKLDIRDELHHQADTAYPMATT